jgi:hypothetical protein
MNKITTLSAIAMVAVIMGMSAFAPAMASNGSNGQKTTICHFEEEFFDEDLQVTIPAEYSVINVNNRSLPAHMGTDGHEGHGDQLVPSEISADACRALNNPT